MDVGLPVSLKIGAAGRKVGRFMGPIGFHVGWWTGGAGALLTFTMERGHSLVFGKPLVIGNPFELGHP